MTILERTERLMNLRFQVLDLQSKMSKCGIGYYKWLELYRGYEKMANFNDLEMDSIRYTLGTSLVNVKVVVRNDFDRLNLDGYRNLILENLNTAKKVLSSNR